MPVDVELCQGVVGRARAVDEVRHPAERVTLPLNGTWQIADSVAAEPAPKAFRATVAVPGLVHNATPGFADVDAFDSLELVANQIAQKIRPEAARVASPGVSRQKRNYFWYRRQLPPPARRLPPPPDFLDAVHVPNTTVFPPPPAPNHHPETRAKAPHTPSRTRSFCIGSDIHCR